MTARLGGTIQLRHSIARHKATTQTGHQSKGEGEHYGDRRLCARFQESLIRVGGWNRDGASHQESEPEHQITAAPGRDMASIAATETSQRRTALLA